MICHSRGLTARFAFLLLLAPALPASMAGCGSKPQTQTIVVNVAAEPETLDPALMTGVPEHRVISMLMQGLTRLGADNLPYPGLAESWESNDDKTVFTFHLREAKWSNGDPITANDVVWSWRRMIDPATAADYAYQLYYLENAEAIQGGKLDDKTALGVRAIDDRTVEARLTGPTPFFPSLVAHTAYIPVHPASVEASSEWHLHPETYVGSGPFKLVEWLHQDRIVADRNPLYWDAASVKLNRVVARMIEVESVELKAYEAGQLDLTYVVPRSEIPRLRERPDFHIGPLTGTYYLGINCEHPPFDDVRVREAFTLAVDRQSIVDNISRAGEQPAIAWVPPGMPNPATGKDFREEKAGYFADKDVEQAKRLLAEAGYPDGKGFPTVKYIFNTQENHKVIAEALQWMWAETLGVEVSLENQEWKTYLDNRNKGNFDLSRAGWIADIPDPTNFLDVFLSTSGNNNSNWNNAEYDALMEQIKQTVDQAKRFELMHQAEDILMSEYPLCPIYYYEEPYMRNPKLKEFVRNSLGWWDFSKAYLEE